MTREEALELKPGDQVLIADGLADGDPYALANAKQFWGTVQTIDKIDRYYGDKYPVKIVGFDDWFSHEEVELIREDDAPAEEVSGEGENINLLFDMYGIPEVNA